MKDKLSFGNERHRLTLDLDEVASAQFYPEDEDGWPAVCIVLKNGHVIRLNERDYGDLNDLLIELESD